MVSLSPDIRRLKTLIGLGNDSPKAAAVADSQQQFESQLIEMPTAPELLVLLQKQEQLMAQLNGELELYKADMLNVRAQSMSAAAASEAAIEEMRRQWTNEQVAAGQQHTASVKFIGKEGECRECQMNAKRMEEMNR